MSVSANDRERLVELSESKEYRDVYLDTHVRSRIAYQIQALRDRLGLSQAAFSDKIGMKQSVISRLENPEYGRVTVQTLLQIASALDIALSVKFCDYTEFLQLTANVAPNDLVVESIYETINMLPSSDYFSSFSPAASQFVAKGNFVLATKNTLRPGSTAYAQPLGNNLVLVQAA